MGNALESCPPWKREQGSLEHPGGELHAIRHLGPAVPYEDRMPWGWEELQLGWEELRLGWEELQLGWEELQLG